MENHVKQAPVQGVTGLWGGTQGALTSGASGPKIYVDEVFSTYLRYGDGGNQSVTNGLDLSGEGGFVWVKERNSGNSHTIFSTDIPDVSNKRPYLSSNTDFEAKTKSNIDIQFNDNGYQIQGDDGQINQNSNNTYVDWSFRKCPGFLDIVTWTGDGNGSRQISHSLGSVPGCIMIKRYDGSYRWYVYHRSMDASYPERYYLKLNEPAARQNTTGQQWMAAAPTDTHFTLAADIAGSGWEGLNTNGQTMIAYVFAHDEQSFGSSGDSSVIKCGSYTGNGNSSGVDINLGWEPQWVLMKAIDTGNNWAIIDCMRGSNGQEARRLNPDGSSSEITVGNYNTYAIQVTSTGFSIKSNDEGGGNGNGNSYLYVAIRRSDGYVGKPADAGTDVFTIATGNSSASIPNFVSNFPVDLITSRGVTGTSDWYTSARLSGTREYLLNTTTTSGGSCYTYDSNVGAWKCSSSSSAYAWMWKRHAGFDVVCYDGTGSTRTINHSLNKVPEMMWFKRRDGASNWIAYHVGMNGGSSPEDYALQINGNHNQENNANHFNDTAPTSSVFTLGGGNVANGSGDDMTAFLFASVAGISKCGYYTGTGTSSVITVTTGFQPRLLILKGTGNSDYWWLLDTTRGWGSGNDQYIPISATDAQNGHDFGAPTSTGFTIPAVNNSSYNGTGQNYIYYAHA